MNEKDYHARRLRVLEKMQPGVAVIAAATLKTRSNDTEYPYRQNSDFYYLCGFEEDNAVLVFVKERERTQTLLFVQPKVEEMELWSGKRLGVEAAQARFSVDETVSVELFAERIKALLNGHGVLYCDMFEDETMREKLLGICAGLTHDRHVKISPRTFSDITAVIRELRLIKSDEEIALIRQALAITKTAHHKAMQEAKAGLYEYQLQASIEHTFKANGAYSDAYTTIVAGGNNANTLHYIKNDVPLKAGELVLIDAGCEYKMYASDITRTFPVGGTFSPAQRELYELVLAVQESVIEMIRPGLKKAALQRHAEVKLTEGMIALGILEGECEALIEAKAHKKFFPHGIGHWMGLDVHDPCPYVDETGEEIVLAAGMVMTIEPGLYIDESREEVPKRYRGIGIRIEDNIVVTETGAENLCADIAKSVEAVEALCNA